MPIKVIEFKILDGHRINVHFSNGMFGTHDLASLDFGKGPMSEPLREEGYFRRAFVEFGALTWPNGFDISPEWLRREMEAAGELHYAKAAE